MGERKHMLSARRRFTLNDGNNDDEEGNNGDKEDNEDDEKDSGHELLKKIAIYFQKMGRGVKGCSEYLRKFIKFLEDLVR